eukprot:192311_1
MEIIDDNIINDIQTVVLAKVSTNDIINVSSLSQKQYKDDDEKYDGDHNIHSQTATQSPKGPLIRSQTSTQQTETLYVEKPTSPLLPKKSNGCCYCCTIL